MRPITHRNQQNPLPSHYSLTFLILPGTVAHTGALGLDFLVPLPCWGREGLLLRRHSHLDMVGTEHGSS